MLLYQIPGVQTLPGEKKTRFENWLSKNKMFRFHCQGKTPVLDLKKARANLFERIGESERSLTHGNTVPLKDQDNESASGD